MNNLPNEILNHIKSYIRYDVMHKLCKETCKLGKCRCECHERQLMEVLQDDAKRHEL